MESIRAHLRLAILQILEATSGYGLHEYLLLERLRALGLGTTTADLHADLQWLATRALIRLEPVGEGAVAHLTGEGQGVVRDTAPVAGVARPRP